MTRNRVFIQIDRDSDIESSSNGTKAETADAAK